MESPEIKESKKKQKTKKKAEPAQEAQAPRPVENSEEAQRLKKRNQDLEKQLFEVHAQLAQANESSQNLEDRVNQTMEELHCKNA